MQERIAQEALQEIRQRGFKFSMRELASRLGISTKTLYQHFASKELLVASIVEHAITQMKDRERELMSNSSLTTKRKLYEALVLLPQGFAFTDIRILHELRNAYPNSWRVMDDYLNRGWGNIRLLIRQGIDEGVLRPFDVDIFIDVYVGALYRMMNFEIAGHSGMALEKALGLTVDFLLYGILIGENKGEL